MEAWFWILCWFHSIFTMTGNGFIVFLVCRRRQFHTKANAFVVSLAVADFCVGMSASPSLFFCERARGCNSKGILSNGVDYLRWLFVFASMGNLCSFTLKSPFIITLSGWLSVVLELLECVIVILCFATTLAVVYRHERTARTLAKQIRFNHPVMLKHQENSALKMMGVIITLFLMCNKIFFRCSFLLIFNDGKPCSDLQYKAPILLLNSACNPLAYAVFKRDIKKEFNRLIYFVIES